MEYHPIRRAPGAFQQAVTEAQVDAMCRRAFGADMRVRSAVELGDGFFNNTYRVDLGSERQLILRVAPEPTRQPRAEPGADAK